MGGVKTALTVNGTPACEAEAGLSSHTSPLPLAPSLIASDLSSITHYILPTAAAISPMYRPTTFSVWLRQENWPVVNENPYYQSLF